MFFLTGAFVPVLNSIILHGQYPYKDGLYLQFKKPQFQLWALFLGMTAFFIPSYIYKKYIKKKSGRIRSTRSQLIIFRQVSIPAICNIIATLFLNKSLIFMDTTVWQIFFGFQILFATLFAITIRKQHLFLVDWLGLFVSVAGMCFSGVAALLRVNTTENSQTITEIFFSFIICIFSHGITAFQTILEEKLLHDLNLDGATLTAYEGLWGLFICTFILLPISSIIPQSDDFMGIYENSLETFQILGNSKDLIFLLVGYILTVSLFSYFGITITDFSTAIHRNLYEIIRPLPVWILSVTARYIQESSYIGEPIDKYTALELSGFLIAMIGSFIYNRIIKFPCFTYIEDEIEDKTKLLNNNILKTNLKSTLLSGNNDPNYTDNEEYIVTD